MNKVIIAIEIIFCLLLFSLSNKQEETSSAIGNQTIHKPEVYQLERSACFSRPADQVNHCLNDPRTKQY